MHCLIDRIFSGASRLRERARQGGGPGPDPAGGRRRRQRAVQVVGQRVALNETLNPPPDGRQKLELTKKNISKR